MAALGGTADRIKIRTERNKKEQQKEKKDDKPRGRSVEAADNLSETSFRRGIHLKTAQKEQENGEDDTDRRKCRRGEEETNERGDRAMETEVTVSSKPEGRTKMLWRLTG